MKLRCGLLGVNDILVKLSKTRMAEGVYSQQYRSGGL